MKLSDLGVGKDAIIIYCGNRRLNDLGFLTGANVVCVYKSPLGDPVAFLVQKTVIALRIEDSRCIEVE